MTHRTMVSIPNDAWEPAGPDDHKEARLLTTLVVNGCDMFLEAFQVKTNKYGQQAAANSLFDKNLDGAYIAGDPEGPFETVKIDGRDYVLVATPYC